MKKEKTSDVVGRKVRLNRQLRTSGGFVFEAGTEMLCHGRYHGFNLLSLKRIKTPEGGFSVPGISRVPRFAFEIVS